MSCLFCLYFGDSLFNEQVANIISSQDLILWAGVSGPRARDGDLSVGDLLEDGLLFKLKHALHNFVIDVDLVVFVVRQIAVLGLHTVDVDLGVWFDALQDDHL